jgi:hypothetical protein
MKFDTIVFCIIAATFVTSAHSFSLFNSDVDTVKETVIKLDTTRSIGQAFDQWDKCSAKKWDTVKSNKRNIVSFYCKFNIDQDVKTLTKAADINQNPDDKKIYLNVIPVEYSNKLLIYVDGKDISFAGTEVYYKFKNGKVYKEVEHDATRFLKTAYNNYGGFFGEEDSQMDNVADMLGQEEIFQIIKYNMKFKKLIEYYMQSK